MCDLSCSITILPVTRVKPAKNRSAWLSIDSAVIAKGVEAEKVFHGGKIKGEDSCL